MKIIQRSSLISSIRNGTKIKKRGENLKVLAVTKIEELEHELQSTSDHTVHVSSEERYQYLRDSLNHIEDVLEREDFDAVVINRYLDQSEDGVQIVELFRRIKKKRPAFRMILILSEYDKRVVYPLVKAGIYDLIISSDISCSSIIKLLDEPAEEFDFKAYEVSDEKRQGINIQMPTFKTKEKWKSKKVITVYSPYSCGASETAIALTKALSKKSDKVCLVDFDFLRPSIREKLSLKTTDGLNRALEMARQDDLSAKNILSVLSKKDNYSVLTGLYELNEIYNAHQSYFEKIIEVLKSNFEFLVIDVHSYHDLKPSFVAFDQSDLIYIVTKGERKILENTMRYVEMFRKYEDVNPDQLKVVINDYGGLDLTCVEIEKIVGDSVSYIPRIEGWLIKKISKKAYEKSIEEMIKEL